MEIMFCETRYMYTGTGPQVIAKPLDSWDFVNTRNGKSREKISGTAKFEVCSIGI